MTTKLSFRNQCQDKAQYKNERVAKAARRAVKRRKGHEGLSVYRCPWCGAYHLGRIIGA